MTWPTDFDDAPATDLENQQDAVTGDDDPSYTGPTGSGFHVGHHNALATAIATIQSVLGINPAGSAASVAARFDVEDPKIVGPDGDIDFLPVGVEGEAHTGSPSAGWVQSSLEQPVLEYHGLYNGHVNAFIAAAIEDYEDPEASSDDVIAVIPEGFRPLDRVVAIFGGFETSEQEENGEFVEVEIEFLPNGEVKPLKPIRAVEGSEQFESEFQPELEIAVEPIEDRQVMFWKDRGIVYMAGVATALEVFYAEHTGQNEQALPILQLPDGYRPLQPYVGQAQKNSHGEDSWARIDTDGNVFPLMTAFSPGGTPPEGSCAMLFDGIAFRAA